MTGRPDWDDRLMALAAQIGSWSKDRSARTGCVITGSDRLIRSTGFNGFVRGVDDDDDARHQRPAKYLWTEHAERNAIYNAARLGISLEGCTAYMNWFPCVDCSRGLVQAGVIRLVVLEPDHADERWGADFTLSTAMLAEAGVTLTVLDLPHLSARFGGGATEG
jgi:dCMP deaminase